MKPNQISYVAMAALALALPARALPPVGSTFTYQGSLSQDGFQQATDYDLRFSLWDAETDGNQVGPMLEFPAVNGGLFTVELDFGAGAFDGTARWLRVDVREVGDSFYTLLNPRQPITPAPYALHALNAGQWQNSGTAITNTNTGFVGINRTNTVGLEWFGVHAPVPSGYGGMYVTTEGATAWPFYGYRSANGQVAWTYLDGGDGDWHVNVDGNKLTVTDEGTVGIRTTDPAYPLHVVSSNTDRTIHGENSSASGAGVRAQASHATGSNFGIYGETASSSGTAVFGIAAAPSGVTYGGRFTTDSASGTGVDAGGGFIGVAGSAWSSAGDTWGGLFQNQSSAGAGVRALSNGSSGSGKGVWGSCASPTGYAGYFTGGRNYFQGNVGCGTDNPANPLSVVGDADITGRVSIGITGPDARLLVRGAAGEDAFRVRVDTASKLVVRDNGGVAIGSNFGTVPANGLRIAGDVGIGIDPTDKLHVSGNIRATGSVFASCGTLSCSDQRFKTNVRPLAYALDTIDKLRPVSFDWKREEYPDHQFSAQRQTGLIAQQIREVLPDLVQEAGDGYLSVDYARLTPLLVAAVREVRQECKQIRAAHDRQLEDRDQAISALQAENAALGNRLERLERLMAGQIHEMKE